MLCEMDHVETDLGHDITASCSETFRPTITNNIRRISRSMPSGKFSSKQFRVQAVDQGTFLRQSIHSCCFSVLQSILHLHPARDNNIFIVLGKNIMSIVLCLEMTRIQQKHSSSEVRGHPLLEDDITIRIATRIHHNTHSINCFRFSDPY